MLAELAGLCETAVAEGVVPGLVVRGVRRGVEAVSIARGARSLEPAHEAATEDTRYDLASLTKALCTSILAMQAVEAGRLDLDRPCADYLPGLPDLARLHPHMTARLLLSHASGLPAHRALHRIGAANDRAATRQDVVAACAATPAELAPGQRAVYSDLGFILLGALLEELWQERLDACFARRISGPLGLAGLAFQPRDAGGTTPAAAALPGANAPPVAPTERCPVRGVLTRGEVHDLNAWAMGGVAGHAGLFGSASDVAALASALGELASERGAAAALPGLSGATVRAFFAPAGTAPASTWGLGWDHPAATGSLAGALLPRSAVGHLGFTGTSLWLDPGSGTVLVVLSNRVHPVAREDTRMRALRPALNDALWRALDASERSPRLT